MALAVRWATAEDASSIGAFVDRQAEDGSFEHLYEFQRVRAEDQAGAELWYALAEDDRRLVGVAPLLRTQDSADGTLEFGGSTILAVDRRVAGVLAEAILERARAERIEVLSLTLPDRELRRAFGARLDVDHFTQRLLLPSSAEAYEASLVSKRRNHIQMARKKGLRIEVGGLEALEPWWEVYGEVSDRVITRHPEATSLTVSAPETYRSLLEGIAARCRVRIVGLWEGDHLVGGQVVLSLGRTAFMYRGGVKTGHMGHGSGDLLLLGVVREAIEQGCTVLDLGATSAAGEGVYRFKRAYGARHRDNSQIVCQVSGASALFDARTLPLFARGSAETERLLRGELLTFLLGPPPSDPAEPPHPSAVALMVAPAALPGLQLPLLEGAEAPARAAVAGPAVSASALEDLGRRVLHAPPLPLVAALEGSVAGGFRATTFHGLVRPAPPTRFETVRPRDLDAARVAALPPGSEILLVLGSRADVRDLHELTAPGAESEGLRLPADRFGRVPVRLLDGCRLMPMACPAARLETLHLVEDGLVRPCRPGPALGPPGTSVRAAGDLLVARAAALSAARDCARCPVASSCGRCLADAPLGSDDDYCDTRRAFPRLGQLAILVEAVGRFVARRLLPAAESFEWRAPGEVLPDDLPAPAGTALPGVPADVLVIRVDGRPIACRLRTGAFAEVGETLADLLELARVAPSLESLCGHLRREWDADEEDIRTALAALDGLLSRLARLAA